MSYNCSVYKSEDGDRLTFEAAGELVQVPQTLTTGSTGTVTPCGFTFVSSAGTAKTFTMDTPTVGMFKTIYCTNATATGYIGVTVGNTGLKTNGTNTIYKFKKADTWVTLYMASTSRWYEVYRSVADGTALTGT